MGISSAWCLMAAVLIISANGAPQSYYKPTETSSPAPPPSPPQGQQLVGSKELVLYLTPDQVEALEAAGAIIKPFPQFEKEYLQQQEQQKVDENTETKNEPANSDEDSKPEKELEELYKILNMQDINENLSVKQKSAEKTTEKPRQKNKYSPKVRQQDYSYVPKKANKAKSYSTEYVRYLPNYEVENLKMEQYRPQPPPGFRYETINLKDSEIEKYFQTEAPQVKKPEEIKKPQEIQRIIQFPTRAYSIQTFQVQQPTESSVQTKSGAEDTGPVTFEGKSREPAKVEEEPEERPVETQSTSEERLPATLAELQAQEQEKPKSSTPTRSSAVIQRQYSSLLAPLIQHDKIAESIAEQKKALLNSELEIHNKLKEIKESGTHDEEKIAIELKKLTENLEKQNALSEKLALDIAKKSLAQIQGKEQEEEQEDEQENEQEDEQEEEQVEEEGEEEEQKEEPAKKQPAPIPVIAKIPESRVRQSFSSPLEIVRPISVVKTEKIEVEKPVPVEVEKRVPIPVTRNVYVKVDKPYLVQKIVPVQVKHEVPVTYPVHQPEKLTIIRHIWEH